MALSHSIARSIAPQYLCNDSVLHGREKRKRVQKLDGSSLSLVYFEPLKIIEMGTSAVNLIFECSFFFIYIGVSFLIERVSIHFTHLHSFYHFLSS